MMRKTCLGLAVLALAGCGSYEEGYRPQVTDKQRDEISCKATAGNYGRGQAGASMVFDMCMEAKRRARGYEAAPNYLDAAPQRELRRSPIVTKDGVVIL